MPTEPRSPTAPTLNGTALGADSRTVVLQDGREITAAELRGHAVALAAALRERGCTRAVVAGDRADLVAAALLAVRKVGCQLLLLPPGRAPEAGQLRDWNVDAVIDGSRNVDAVAGSPGAPAAGCAVLLATSGTSGAEPKIARHSIESLLGRIRVPAGAGQERVWLLTYPPASFAGLQVVLTVLAGGGRLVALSAPTVPTLARELVDRGVTHVSGTPTLFRALVLALAGKRAPGLRQITLGGEAVDDATLELLRAVFPQAALTHIYASTEAGALFAVRDGAAGFPARWLDEGIDGVRLRIRGGVLEVRSPRAMSGYLGDEAPSPLTEDGWLRTGDLTEIDGDRVHFRGRADATINVGGAKVQPEKIEAELLALDGVHEVRVFGKKNPITGAVVAAEIVAAAGTEERTLRNTISAAMETRLAAHERPRILRFVASIETNPSGKKGRNT